MDAALAQDALARLLVMRERACQRVRARIPPGSSALSHPEIRKGGTGQASTMYGRVSFGRPLSFAPVCESREETHSGRRMTQKSVLQHTEARYCPRLSPLDQERDDTQLAARDRRQNQFGQSSPHRAASRRSNINFNTQERPCSSSFPTDQPVWVQWTCVRRRSRPGMTL